MKKAILTAVLSALVILPGAATASTSTAIESPAIDTKCQWINGYYRKDGTYVEGHYRGCGG